MNYAVESSVFGRAARIKIDRGSTLTDIDGVRYTKDQLYWHEGKYIDGTDGHWLSTSTVIPEPAACAVIFGAAVLALAALRRRK